eukprot:6728607-Prymnesium_polylepis.2
MRWHDRTDSVGGDPTTNQSAESHSAVPPAPHVSSGRDSGALRGKLLIVDMACPIILQCQLQFCTVKRSGARHGWP